MRLTPLEPWIARKTADRGPQTAALTNDEGRATKVERPSSFVLRHSSEEQVPSAVRGLRSAVSDYQLARLKATVELARTKSRFYRERLSGVAEVESLDDLASLPLTTAEDVRADPLAFVCVSQDEIARVVTLDSSGTTGTPKRLYFTKADQELTVDFFGVGMSTFTGPGDRVLILLPGETPGSVGDLLAKGLERIGAVPIKHGPVRDPAATRAVAVREAATVMVGVPTHLLRLVRTMAPGEALPPVHSVLLSTDHVPQAIVHAIESAWGCTVYNHYGMTETGLGGGVDCKARRGYHLREADLLYEVIDPGTGLPAAPGKPGEVVFTTLTREGMPLIRYRTGDYGHWLETPCPCGTSLKTLSHITTRLSGPVDLGGGLWLTQPDLDEALFAVDGVLNFATEVARAEAGPRVSVAIQITPTANPDIVRAEALNALRALPPFTSATRLSLDLHLSTEPISPPTLAKRAIKLS